MNHLFGKSWLLPSYSSILDLGTEIQLSSLGVGLLVALIFCPNTMQAQEWEYLGLPQPSIYGIAVQDQDTIFVSTTRLVGQTPGIVFKTTNGGSSWDTVLYDASALPIKIHPRDPLTVYTGLGSFYPPYGLLKTTDSGRNWFHADSGMEVNGERLVRVIEFDPTSPETLYAGTSGPQGGDLYRSTNGGTSWTSIAAPGLFGGVLSLAIDPFDTRNIYAGTGYEGIYKTSDGGNNWEVSLQTNHQIAGIGIDPVDPNILYAGVGNGSGCYRSSDGGINWIQSADGLPDNVGGGYVAVNGISRDVYIIVYPDSVGLFKSTDLGLTWQRVGGLISGINAAALSISPDQSQIYLGIRSLGIYRTSILISSVWNMDAPLPSIGEILNNYPNPFNVSTVIQYKLSGVSEISIKVYDILGNEVATLVKGRATAGFHKVLFDGRNLSTGIYFSRLSSSSGETATAKLLLIR